MEHKFIKLTSPFNEGTVIVNVSKIIMMSRDPLDQETVITLDDHNTITVVDTVESIMECIRLYR